MFEHTSFFAIIMEPNNQLNVMRVHLSQDAQTELCEIFSREAEKFLNPDLDAIEFDGRYNPEDGEIHLISNYPIQQEITNALKEPTAIRELRLTDKMMLPIKAILTGIYKDKPIIAFQKFDKRQYLKRAGLVNLIFDGKTFTKVSNPGLNISEKIDALIHNNSLLFTSFWNTRQFLNISTYYREATDIDIEKFANHPTINITDKDAFWGGADNWIRKKIGLLLDSGALDNYSPVLVKEKAEEYGVPLEVCNNNGREQLVLSGTKKEIKEALRFLDEDYFSGPLSDTKFMTNSKKQIL